MMLSKASTLTRQLSRQSRSSAMTMRQFSTGSSSTDPPKKQLTRAPSSFSNKQHGISPSSAANLKISKSPFESIWDKNDLSEIFSGNLAYRSSKLAQDPDYFKKMAKGQAPQYLLIGCSDSRVGAQELMGLDQGELFIHRNIANVFVPTDMNLLSVIFYSVNVLKVKDIIVLGHYECGGVRAASQNVDLGLIESWLSNIRDVQRHHKDELAGIADAEEKHRRLVELNVQEQCFKLYGNNIIQQMQAKTGRPRIHGLVYDIADGKLIDLDVDFKQIIRKYRDIYTVADFRHHTPISIDRAIQKDADVSTEATTEEMKQDYLHGLDRLVVVRRTDAEDGTIVRPLQCRGSTTLHDVKMAIENLTGLSVESQGLYKKVEEGLVSLTNNKLTLAEAKIADICELELKEEIVPKGFRKQ